MKRFLFKIEDTFDITGRGLVLVPTIPENTDLPKSGTVSLVRPDGVKLEAEAIFGISFFSFSNIEDRKNHISGYECTIQNISEEEIPIGTEVWLN